MNWTTEKPKKKGWYWHQEKRQRHIIWVQHYTGCFRAFGAYHHCRNVEHIGGQWAGPIPEPGPMKIKKVKTTKGKA